MKEPARNSHQDAVKGQQLLQGGVTHVRQYDVHLRRSIVSAARERPEPVKRPSIYSRSVSTTRHYRFFYIFSHNDSSLSRLLSLQSQ